MPIPSTSASPSAEPSGPPADSAEAQKVLFDETNQATVSAGGGANPGGRAFIDALVAVGYDKGSMEVTPDETAIALDADNIQFSVRWGDDCLIGQVGPATGNPVAIVADGLPDGGCLLGSTRAIDW